MELVVTVKEAKKLIIPGGVFNVKDTYVYIRYAGESFRSKTETRNTDQPHWKLSTTIKEIVPEDMDITIDVFREHLLGYNNIHIGKSIIRIPDHNRTFKSWVHISCKGKFTGEVLVQLKWQSVGTQPEDNTEITSNINSERTRRGTMPPNMEEGNGLGQLDERRRDNITIFELPDNFNIASSAPAPVPSIAPVPIENEHGLTASTPSTLTESIAEQLPVDIKRFAPSDLSLMTPSLGSGTFGEVHRCFLDGRLVAVKTFHVNVHTDNGTQSFLREVKTMYLLNCPHIVNLIGIADEQSGKHQIVMEFMDNGNLRDFLNKRHARFGKDHNLAELFPIALQIAKALAYLHSKDIIHRDIKPANILLNKNRKVKLSDFGIAREDSEQSKTNAAGSTIWMAPEVINSTRYTTSADIFSLGVILTELDMLVQPYKNERSNVFALRGQIANGKRPPLRKNCVSWYKELVEQCLQESPSARPTAAEILKSPCIVKLIGIATSTTGKRQIAMEYMNNGNLRNFLNKRLEKVGDLNELLPIALQIAKGIEYLHSQNIIHRDIKPANVLLNKRGNAKLGDFGIAREDSEESKTNAMGSTTWMAPEVIKSTTSLSADILSLGVILTELDMLVQPYLEVKCHIFSIQNQMLQGRRPPLRPNCPVRYKELRCLEADPNCRPTAAEIVETLELHLNNNSDLSLYFKEKIWSLQAAFTKSKTLMFIFDTVVNPIDQIQIKQIPIIQQTTILQNIVAEDMDIVIDVYRERMWGLTDFHIGKSIVRIPDQNRTVKQWIKISSTKKITGDILQTYDQNLEMVPKFSKSNSTTSNEENSNMLLPSTIKIYSTTNLELIAPSIGSGSNGEIHCCHIDEELFVVKTFHAHIHNDINLFIKHVNQIHQFDSPHIVKIVGIATDKHKRQIVMEYMDDGNLRGFLDKRLEKFGNDHELKDLLPIALQIAKGISYLHSQNVIHRYITPTKILLDNNGNAKLGDFNIGEEMPEKHDSDEIKSFLWMAPEVVNFGEYSTSADIFSLGVILTELDLLIEPFSQAKWNLDAIKLCIERGLRPSLCGMVQKVNRSMPSVRSQLSAINSKSYKLNIPGGIYQIRSIRNTRVRIKYGYESFLSKIVNEQTHYPMWNASTKIRGDDINPKEKIKLEVFRERRLLPDMLIGMCEINIPSPEEVIEDWFSLTWDGVQISGQVRVHIKWHGKRNKKAIITPALPRPIELIPAPNVSIISNHIKTYEPDELHEVSNVGAGAYAIVSQCIVDGKMVAVKKFHIGADIENYKSVFEKEINTLRQCDSEYVIKMLGIVNTRNGHNQFVLEYMDGGHLGNFLVKRKKYYQSKRIKPDLYEMLPIALQIAQGLEYLHKKNLIHRDIKPANILMDKRRRVKIGDLGGAREEDTNQSLTNGAGSLKWMAPEVRKSTRYTTAADIYSFGVILTELDTLEEPFANIIGGALFTELNKGLKPSTRPDCVQWYKELANQCLQDNPEDRPTAEQLRSLDPIRGVVHPYVFIRYSGHTKKSWVHKKGKESPKWDVEAHYSNIDYIRYPNISLEVYDEDPWGGGDMFIGACAVQVPIDVRNYERWVPIYHGAEMTGFVCFQCDSYERLDCSYVVRQSISLSLSKREPSIDLEYAFDSLIDSKLRRGSTASTMYGSFEDIEPLSPDEPQIHPTSMVKNDAALLLHTHWIAAEELVLSTPLGTGAYGSIARGVYDKKDVAIKTFHLTKAGEAAFELQVAVYAKLDPKFVVELYGIGRTDWGQPQIVMEYMENGNLHEFIDYTHMRERSSHSLQNILPLVLDAAMALAHIHQHNIVHGNVKPTNALLTLKNQVKLSDFGFPSTSTYASTRLTQWTAPEMLASHSFSYPADVFALGVMMTELESLQRPYSEVSCDRNEFMTRFLKGNLRPSLSEACPTWFEQLAMDCMDSDPLHRPSADEIVSILRQRTN
ncbi:serine/threonine-protein kinase PAK 3-like [Thraustotheca clavata]|uniref:Serine/threonine-protein kinase PAK 3-like n=1 Tax=Thraustotheca clavata TaxID=74557 RepID=A0A1V9Y7T8_9STRA|nr:serine/threonine-protein kinase PAK 3-like [Thraustotheca clavata]